MDTVFSGVGLENVFIVSHIFKLRPSGASAEYSRLCFWSDVNQGFKNSGPKNTLLVFVSFLKYFFITTRLCIMCLFVLFFFSNGLNFSDKIILL